MERPRGLGGVRYRTPGREEALYTLILSTEASLSAKTHSPPNQTCFTDHEKEQKPDNVPSQLSDTETLRQAMNSSPGLQQPGPAASSMGGQLSRSFPSSHSIASTTTAGMSTPNPWSANEWLHGTPDTSPPSSGVGSPEIQAKRLLEDGSVSSVEESTDSRSGPAAKNVCFVGAGFVGMVRPNPPSMRCRSD